MGKTNRIRVTAYVSDEVAERLEAIRRDCGVVSISKVAGDILTRFATGRPSSPDFSFKPVTEQHPELKEDTQPTQLTQPELTQPSPEPRNGFMTFAEIEAQEAIEAEERRARPSGNVVTKSGYLVLGSVERNQRGSVGDQIRNAPPSQPARNTYVPLEPRPETMPGLNTRLQPDSTSAPTASQSEFTMAPPTPIGSDTAQEEREQDDAFGWRSEQAR